MLAIVFTAAISQSGGSVEVVYSSPPPPPSPKQSQFSNIQGELYLAPQGMACSDFCEDPSIFDPPLVCSRLANIEAHTDDKDTFNLYYAAARANSPDVVAAMGFNEKDCKKLKQKPSNSRNYPAIKPGAKSSKPPVCEIWADPTEFTCEKGTNGRSIMCVCSTELLPEESQMIGAANAAKVSTLALGAAAFLSAMFL